MEVMGLMLGEFVDDYTVRVIDVFAMPQTGTVNIKTRLKIEYVCMTLGTYSYVISGCQCRGGGSSVSSKDVGHAEADRSTGNGSGLVSFSPGFRMLAVRSGY